jgi:hypothetical protein
LIIFRYVAYAAASAARNAPMMLRVRETQARERQRDGAAYQ